MNDVSKCIVLSNMDYREKDVLVSVLSEEFGRLSFVVKSAMSMNSKNAPACLPLATSEFHFDYKERKTVFSLKTARLLENRREIREDLTLLNLAACCCELVEKITEQGVQEKELFDVLTLALDHMKEDANLSFGLFLSYVFKWMGIEPVIDECVLCGSTKVSSISVKEGGFVCAACRLKVSATSCTLDDLVHFRLINKASFEHFDVLNEKMQFSKKDLETMMDFLRHHAGIQLRSWQWISSLMD